MTETEKLARALKGIADYIKKKKPETMAQALHMLALVEVIATETLAEVKP